HFMQRGRVSCVVVGADRVAANGDLANKIGTYAHAVLAHRHAIPFYVAAPLSTVDLACARGEQIPIEERPGRDVSHVVDRQVAPRGTTSANRAVEGRRGEWIRAIIPERGDARQPLGRTLARLASGSAGTRPARAERRPERRREARKERRR